MSTALPSYQAQNTWVLGPDAERAAALVSPVPHCWFPL